MGQFCTMTPINRIAVWDSTASATDQTPKTPQTPQSLEPALLNNGVVYGIRSRLCDLEKGGFIQTSLSHRRQHQEQ